MLLLMIIVDGSWFLDSPALVVILLYNCVYKNTISKIIIYRYHMKVIFSISNPATKEFLWTRHNIGRIFVSQHLLKNINNQEHNHNKYKSYTFPQYPNLIVCTSETYMNLSGQAVAVFFKRNPNISKQNLMVVHDDLEHKFGNVRIKKGGSAQ